ncbi:hypothetical protein K431DRAFT_301603 [Polychaeton citri CBS 116435]|uniref:Oxo-4-hydroxy-4-carboxy-5-ureidoimidazoline decarboxylase domain-containing protein n=1 Tax=Polychaeton citri CBS 116435 TaxID=1314669 RepID=A0A9P4QF56_9PEZI|nr:hypothetical protein K431DRAFT_301603 [Polychaeton citri CBS 116435]
MDSLPPTVDLPTLPQETKTAILDTLFEPSAPLHTLALPPLSSDPPPDSYASLISSIQSLLLSLSASESSTDQSQLTQILTSHPRLGEKKVESALSRKEQAQLQQPGQQQGGGSSGGNGEAEELKRLNEEYEGKFPGLRYVVFVNGRGRPEILEDLRKRVGEEYPADLENEREGIIKAMCDIANDRVKKLSL